MKGSKSKKVSFEDEFADLPELTQDGSKPSAPLFARPKSDPVFTEDPRFVGQVGSEDQESLLKVNFHVSNVAKPLMSVRRIADQGNLVCFGPESHHNFIQHIQSGDRIPLFRKRGIYVVQGRMGGTRDQIEMTVDSGAEESVCPPTWGDHFGIDTTVHKLQFRGADGNMIQHLGDRSVLIHPKQGSKESPF